MSGNVEVLNYGLIGKTLAHSFSKQFFTNKFISENTKASYVNIELKDETALHEFFTTKIYDYNGLNVTIPYKSKVLNFLDNLSPEASQIGAVNTIQIQEGKLIGHNTDAFGFQQSIKPFFKNVHERALILGTGGASKAVAYVLRKLGVTVGFLSRKPNPEEMIFGYDQANEMMVKSFPMIINCTPIGTFPNNNDKPNFPIEYVGKDHLVIDLIYNPEETLFLKIAREHEADTLNGFSMLEHQALKAWEIWTPPCLD